MLSDFARGLKAREVERISLPKATSLGANFMRGADVGIVGELNIPACTDNFGFTNARVGVFKGPFFTTSAWSDASDMFKGVITDTLDCEGLFADTSGVVTATNMFEGAQINRILNFDFSGAPCRNYADAFTDAKITEGIWNMTINCPSAGANRAFMFQDFAGFSIDYLGIRFMGNFEGIASGAYLARVQHQRQVLALAARPRRYVR